MAMPSEPLYRPWLQKIETEIMYAGGHYVTVFEAFDNGLSGFMVEMRRDIALMTVDVTLG